MSAALLFSWLGLTWALGWAAFPLARRLCGDTLPDGGLAAGRVLLFVLWTLAAFWLGHGGVPVHVSAKLGLVLLVGGLIWLVLDRRQSVEAVKRCESGVITTEFVFLFVFLLFFFLRGFWSDTNGNNGEKAMDSALIGSLTRAERLPPENPYAAGAMLSSYYYGGHLGTALLTEATGTTVRWSYNLMCATVPALCFSVLFSLGAGLTGSLSKGAGVALLVLGAGTLQPLYQWFILPPDNADFRFLHLDFFATSRVIPYSINEYPWFTMSQADLHGHYLDFPLELLAMTLAWAYFQGRRGAILAAAPVLGTMVITNTWDFPAYTVMLGLVAISAGKPKRTWLEGPVAKGLTCLGAVVLALVLAGPYLLQLKTAATPPQRLEQPASPLLPWLLLWGPATLAWLTGMYYFGLRRALGCALGGMLLLFCALRVIAGKPYPVLLLEIALLCLTAWGVWRLRDTPRYLCCLAFAGLLTLLWSETTWAGFLGDPAHAGFDDYKRQDTVFKFGLQTWLLWGTATASGVMLSLSRWPLALRAAWAPALGVMFMSSLAVTVARTANFGNPYGWERWVHLVPFDGPRRFDRWDGWAHLTPEEKEAAAWLVGHVNPGEHILEAEMEQGGDYTEFGRYTHATGIPTVIGPTAHSFQWAPKHSGEAGKEWDEVFRRKQLARLAFKEGIVAPEMRSREGMGVRYVIIGELERREYGPATGQLMRQYKTVFRAGTPDDEHRVAILELPR